METGNLVTTVHKGTFYLETCGGTGSDLVDDLDQLHGGESLSCSVLNGCQDLLLSLLPVVDVVPDLHGCVLDHRSVTCSHTAGEKKRSGSNRYVKI